MSFDNKDLIKKWKIKFVWIKKGFMFNLIKNKKIFMKNNSSYDCISLLYSSSIIKNILIKEYSKEYI